MIRTQLLPRWEVINQDGRPHTLAVVGNLVFSKLTALLELRVRVGRPVSRLQTGAQVGTVPTSWDGPNSKKGFSNWGRPNWAERQNGRATGGGRPRAGGRRSSGGRRARSERRGRKPQGDTDTIWTPKLVAARPKTGSQG